MDLVLPALTKLVLDGGYLFITDALLTMLESRVNTKERLCSASLRLISRFGVARLGSLTWGDLRPCIRRAVAP